MPVKFYRRLVNGKGKGSSRVNASIHPVKKETDDLGSDEVGHHLNGIGTAL